MSVVEYGYSFDPMLHIEGKKFFDSAIVLKNSPVHYANSPYFVLLAFSIELMLKSLRVKTTITTSKANPCLINSTKVEHVKGHSLIDVFRGLPEELKAWLAGSILSECGVDLESVLSDHANLFDEARYIYPRNGHIGANGTGYIVSEEELRKVGEFLVSIPKFLYRN